MKKSALGNNLIQNFKDSNSASDFAEGYAGYVADVLSKLDFTQIAAAAKCLIDTWKKSATVFLIGNGGSAATASHFAQDLVECTRRAGKKGIKTFSLTDNVSFITALGNDVNFESIFTGQMENFFKEGDVLLAISASGNSKNILAGVKLARQRKGICIGLTGFDGGKLMKLADYPVHVPTPNGEYGPVEGIHAVVLHMISDYIFFTLKND
jgi:D-sedoheptulose 7-phosphate isomerase